VLQHALEEFRQTISRTARAVPSSIWELRRYLFQEICGWAGADIAEVKAGRYAPSDARRLTLVFDEAQNLSREAIEVMRFWNDADRCYAPFPLGLVFVGNNEFSLQVDGDGQSPISSSRLAGARSRSRFGIRLGHQNDKQRSSPRPTWPIHVCTGNNRRKYSVLSDSGSFRFLR
jgi:hypothetical protein